MWLSRISFPFSPLLILIFLTDMMQERRLHIEEADSWYCIITGCNCTTGCFGFLERPASLQHRLLPKLPLCDSVIVKLSWLASLKQQRCPHISGGSWGTVLVLVWSECVFSGISINNQLMGQILMPSGWFTKYFVLTQNNLSHQLSKQTMHVQVTLVIVLIHWSCA